MMFIINAYRYLSNLIHTTFDGLNEYVDASGLVTSCASNTVGSWSCWVNFDNVSNYQTLLSFGDTNANVYSRLAMKNDGKIEIVLRNLTGASQWAFEEVTASLSINTWYHIVVVQDGVEPKLYINGNLISTTFTLSINKTRWNSFLPTLDNFTIGNLVWNNTTGQYVDGKMAKVIIYNDVLTAGEVTTIYNYGRKAGLIGIGNEVSQWEMDTLNPVDEIGSNNGTSVNMDSSNIVVG